MLGGRRLVAVIPARGGSKGIPRKNLCSLRGRTLVEWAIHAARTSGRVEQTYVSTDDPEIHAIAAAHGCATPQLRPARLATDGARTIDLLRDLTETGIVRTSDALVLLQPTTPLRTGTDLARACDTLEAQWDSADALVSVCQIDGPHPFKAQAIRDGYLRSFVGSDAAVPRQSLPPAFLPNGAFYIGKVDALLAADTFMPPRSIPFVMAADVSINLDGPLDLVLLEAMLARNLVRLDVDAPTSPEDSPHG